MLDELTLHTAAVQLPAQSDEVRVRDDVEADGASVERVEREEEQVVGAEASEVSVEHAHVLLFVHHVHHVAARRLAIGQTE